MSWLKTIGKYERLQKASRILAGQISGCAYLVGSALTSERRPGDIDVRIILSDAIFAKRYLPWIEWQWQARHCEWSREQWCWFNECYLFGVILAHACGERIIDLGILPETFWKATSIHDPHEHWGALAYDPTIPPMKTYRPPVKGLKP